MGPDYKISLYPSRRSILTKDYGFIHIPLDEIRDKFWTLFFILK